MSEIGEMVEKPNDSKNGKDKKENLREGFDKRIEDEIENNGLKTIERLYPSKVAECPRVLYWDYHNPLDFGLKAKKSIWYGGQIHNMVYSLYPDFEKEIKFRFSFKDKVVSGKIDMINKEGYPIEVKSAKSFQYTCSDDHLAQVICYMKQLNVEHGYLYYFHKKYAYPKIFKTTYDETYLNKKLNRLYNVLEKIGENILPKKEETWKCDSCRYKERCKNN